MVSLLNTCMPSRGALTLSGKRCEAIVGADALGGPLRNLPPHCVVGVGVLDDPSSAVIFPSCHFLYDVIQ